MMGDWLRERLQHLEQTEGYVMPESTPLASEQEERVSSEIIRLDANENVFIPRELMSALAKEVAQEVDPRFYATDEYGQLVRALSAHLGLSPDHIVLGNGGDQIIDFIAKTFLDAGAKAVSITPTYSFYRLRAELAGGQWIKVPLREDFSLDVDRLLEAAKGARVIFLCSPNNPTGNQFETDQLREVLKSFDGIAFIDEAYADFADETVAQWVMQYENLVILRTFSKAFGLAGLRLGYLLAHPAVARPFAEKIQYPYPVSSFTLAMGLKLLARFDIIRLAIEQMKTERARLIRDLALIPGIRPFNSEGNFVLFQTESSADEVHSELMNEGIFLKKIGTVLDLRNCLRTTVGMPEMNNRLLETLKTICPRIHANVREHD